MPYLMGLDISTTGAKALIIDESGAVIAVANTPQPISQPKPLWSEQNPADWWAGISASIRSALAQSGLTGDDIAAIGLTGANARSRPARCAGQGVAPVYPLE